MAGRKGQILNRHLSERAKRAKENKRRQSTSSLVSSDETMERIAGELMALPTKDREAFSEGIRCAYFLATGIDKRRLLGGFGSGKPEATPPGNVLMTDLALEASRKLETMQHNWRQERYQRRQELIDFIQDIRKRMEFIDSLDDPERKIERSAKTSAVLKPLSQKA